MERIRFSLALEEWADGELHAHTLGKHSCAFIGSIGSQSRDRHTTLDLAAEIPVTIPPNIFSSINPLKPRPFPQSRLNAQFRSLPAAHYSEDNSRRQCHSGVFLSKRIAPLSPRRSKSVQLFQNRIFRIRHAIGFVFSLVGTQWRRGVGFVAQNHPAHPKSIGKKAFSPSNARKPTPPP